MNLVFNEAFHLVKFVDGPLEGNAHVTIPQTGRFAVEPDDASLGVFTGHFTVRDTGNFSLRSLSMTFTFNATGWSEEGTRIRFHVVDHVNLTATGVLRSFTMESLDCPF